MLFVWAAQMSLFAYNAFEYLAYCFFIKFPLTYPKEGIRKKNVKYSLTFFKGLRNNRDNAVAYICNKNPHRKEPNHSAKGALNKMEPSHRECKVNSNIPFKYASILKNNTHARTNCGEDVSMAEQASHYAWWATSLTTSLRFFAAYGPVSRSRKVLPFNKKLQLILPKKETSHLEADEGKLLRPLKERQCWGFAYLMR